MPKLTFASAVTVLCLALLTGPPPAHAQVRGATAVAVAPLTERDVPATLRLVGTVRAARSAVIATEVSGIVAAVPAEEGQYVQPGDVLCRLDDAVARLKVAEATATLAGLQAQLDEWLNGERPEELARLQAAVAEAEADTSKTEFERQRVAELFERGRSSDKERTDAEMAYSAAANRLAQARAQLDKARNGARAETLARARQAVAAQDAALKRLQRELDRTAIRAPFAGAVTLRRTDVGEWVEAGGAVCEMVALDTVKIRVDVPEAAVPYALPGAPASVEVQALGQSLPGQITRVIPLAAQAARTFPIEIDLPNPRRQILPGMFVWAQVPAGATGTRLMAPKDAIVAQGVSKTVYVLRPGDKGEELATPLPVTTGLELGGEVEISGAGLGPGDRVVVRANERLMGPTPVTPLAARPADSQPAASSPASQPASRP
jgi:HlyD family secretion protein